MTAIIFNKIIFKDRNFRAKLKFVRFFTKFCAQMWCFLGQKAKSSQVAQDFFQKWKNWTKCKFLEKCFYFSSPDEKLKSVLLKFYFFSKSKKNKSKFSTGHFFSFYEKVKLQKLTFNFFEISKKAKVENRKVDFFTSGKKVKVFFGKITSGRFFRFMQKVFCRPETFYFLLKKVMISCSNLGKKRKKNSVSQIYAAFSCP